MVATLEGAIRAVRPIDFAGDGKVVAVKATAVPGDMSAADAQLGAIFDVGGLS